MSALPIPSPSAIPFPTHGPSPIPSLTHTPTPSPAPTPTPTHVLQASVMHCCLLVFAWCTKVIMGAARGLPVETLQSMSCKYCGRTALQAPWAAACGKQCLECLGMILFVNHGTAAQKAAYRLDLERHCKTSEGRKDWVENNLSRWQALGKKVKSKAGFKLDLNTTVGVVKRILVVKFPSPSTESSSLPPTLTLADTPSSIHAPAATHTAAHTPTLPPTRTLPPTISLSVSLSYLLLYIHIYIYIYIDLSP